MYMASKLSFPENSACFIDVGLQNGNQWRFAGIETKKFGTNYFSSLPEAYSVGVACNAFALYRCV
jgi:hypothetical protein